MTPALFTRTETRQKPVPSYALAISLAALAIPVAIVFWFPDWTSNGLGMLIWLTALIPAFLLSYYRGLQGVAIALAGGMAVITATQLSIVAFDIAQPNWILLGGTLGAYLVIAIGIGSLSEALLRERHRAETMALVDTLTGLPNRRHLDLMLTAEFAAAERGSRVSVVMFDLDHFKRINDKHGHGAGDRTLQAFARILQQNTRMENISARYGGEEFVSVLRGAARDDADRFAARVLEQMREWSLPWGHQTVSAGVAEYEKGMGSYELLLAAADLALYRAKEAGRDCVCDAPKAGDAPSAPFRRVIDEVEPPAAEPRTGAAAEATPAVAASPAAHEVLTVPVTVWVVDDNAQLRSMLKSMLARGGYKSWDSGSPQAVIARYAALHDDDRPDVIIADVIMPEMSGIRMMSEIMKISADVRVIYMSGFVQSAISWSGTPGTDAEFLEKPVMMEDLFGALQRVLQRDAAPIGAAARAAAGAVA